MQIEENKLSSSIFAGCTPFEIAKEIAGNFISAAGGVLANIGRGIFGWLKSAASGIASAINWIREAAGKVGQAISGAIAWIGGKLGPCGRLVAGTLIGAVVGGGGLVGLAILAAKVSAFVGGGLLAKIAFSSAMGFALGFVVRGAGKIYNFNWNQTDEEITQSQQGLVRNFYTVLGGALGEATGRIGCGLIPGKAVGLFTVNPGTLARVEELIRFTGGKDGLRDSGQFIQDTVDALWPILDSAARSTAGFLMLSTYKNVRKLIKKSASSGILREFIGEDTRKMLDAWGKPGQNNAWSFKKAVDERVESIKNANLKAFAENFIEELFDSCTDSLLALSYSL
ncbi:hypothetical protein [Laspinema olomoucense]|uniref:hypothetical protein n=1 Tax=Laspinema olomoucense TaxID=3231600 RepID=UPI0021BB9D6C|nr:hypothetical protein [Laspinema sp. D3d]MCT7971084.1 hypothetical protein [Laspinema sp. D3d]